MPKYLVRRRNRFGQWVHIDTMDWEPSREHIQSSYGPGEYNIMVAEEGIRGLRNYATYGIPYSIEYVDWVREKPTVEFIESKYGQGNYFAIGYARDITPIIVSESKNDEMVKDLMLQGIGAMRKIYVIFRLTGLPYRSSW